MQETLLSSSPPKVLEFHSYQGSLATSRSSGSSHQESQPCIPGEYEGLVFLQGGSRWDTGVALLSNQRCVIKISKRPYLVFAHKKKVQESKF